jgi:hypothetical protein
MKTLLPLCALLLLAACAPSRNLKEDQVDDAGFANATAFYVQPVVWDFTPPDEWKLSVENRKALFDTCSNAYLAEFKAVPEHALVLEPQEGACVIAARVRSMTHGAYSVVNYVPATLDVEVTILNAKGEIMYRGTGTIRTPSDAGEKGQTDFGRMDQAHAALAREILHVLDFYKQKRGKA